MYQLVSKLIIYRNIGKDSILFRLAEICRDYKSGEYDKEVLSGRILDEIHRLLDVATTYGFDRNLWHNYLAFLLAMTETPFTLAAEKTGRPEGTVNDFAQKDFAIFHALMNYDFAPMEESLQLSCFSLITDYQSVKKKEPVYNRNVSIRIQEFSRTLEEAGSEEAFADAVMDFYKQYGVGQFGLNKAFRIDPDRLHGNAVIRKTEDAPVDAVVEKNKDLIIPIPATGDVLLETLVGCERQKEALVKNTEAFLAGNPANNVLLYGDAGTGKSTSIKALLNLYYEQGLRMIEVYKHEFQYLPEIISIIKKRNYRFIIYMDDLSFESNETEYKYLKAVIEGDLEVRPENVLIYATSNRRHLLRETFSDRQEMEDDDVHPVDTLAERRSLSDRFGVTIGYFKPARQEYFNIVKELAQRSGRISLPEEELFHEADLWAMRHGGMSGRCAQQFIDYLTGE